MSNWFHDVSVTFWSKEGLKKALKEATERSTRLQRELVDRIFDWQQAEKAGWLASGHAALNERLQEISLAVAEARMTATTDEKSAYLALNAQVVKLETLERDLLEALRALMIPALKMAEDLANGVAYMIELSPRLGAVKSTLKRVDPKACTGLADFNKAMALIGPGIEAFADAACVAAVSAGGDSVQLGKTVGVIRSKVAKRQLFGATQLCMDTFDVSAISEAKRKYGLTLFHQLGGKLKGAAAAFTKVDREEWVTIGETVTKAEQVGSDWDTAEAMYEQGKYAEALEISQRHEAVVGSTYDALRAYVPDRVKVKLEQLRKSEAVGLVEPMLEKVPLILGRVAGLAAFGVDFSTELQELHTLCDQADKRLSDAGKVEDELGAALAVARTLAADLKKHRAYEAYYKERVELIERTFDVDTGKEAVSEALEMLSLLGALDPAYTAYFEARSEAENEADRVVKHAHTTFVEKQKKEYGKLLDGAAVLAKNDDPTQARDEARKALVVIKRTIDLLNAYDEYLVLSGRFDAFASDVLDALQVEDRKLAGFLIDARSNAKFNADKQLLPEARKLLDDALDDTKAMDALVQRLKPEVAGRVVKQALESRFHLKLRVLESESTEIDYTAKNVSIRRIYEVMKTVPDKHHRGTTSFQKLDMFPGEIGTSYYSKTEKLIQLKCGRVEDDKDEEIASTTQLTLPIEEDCRPRENAPKAKVFDFTVLHEVGHAVDDHGRFMVTKRKDGDFADWREHTVADVVAAVHKVWPYDEDYLYEALCGNAVEPVEQPDSYTGDNWDKERTDALAWIAMVRTDAANWWDGAKCALVQAEFGGRVFVESYAREWYSYEHDARKRGITGYQFRSPQEWFAELYAAYRCGQLKLSHPSVQDGQGWLPRLFN